MEILIENLQDKIEVKDTIDELIKRAAVLCLEAEAFTTPSEVSILLVDNSRIKEMNSEHRNIDKETDVLSFPMVEMVEGEVISDCGDFDLNENLLLLGDIVISLEMTQQQAEEYGHSFERELAFLTTHGMFHLLGYDHTDDAEEQLMVGKQEDVLEKMGLKR